MPGHSPLSSKLHHKAQEEERQAAEAAAAAALAAEEQEIAQTILQEESQVSADMQAAEQAAAYAEQVDPGSEAARKAKLAMERAEADERRIVEDYTSAIRAAEDAASSRRLGDVVQAEREMKLAEQYKQDAAEALEDAEKARADAQQAAQLAYAEAQEKFSGSSGTGGPAESLDSGQD